MVRKVRASRMMLTTSTSYQFFYSWIVFQVFRHYIIQTEYSIFLYKLFFFYFYNSHSNYRFQGMGRNYVFEVCSTVQCTCTRSLLKAALAFELVICCVVWLKYNRFAYHYVIMYQLMTASSNNINVCTYVCQARWSILL